MSFGVFIHRTDSIYDDSPTERYQFPSQYLGRARACEGGWIIYYEPRKATGTRGYFAVARVQRIIADPGAPGMYLALIEPGSYLEFVTPVPFSGPDGVTEHGVLNEQGRISGRAQSAVRPLSAQDFNRIIELGLREDAQLLPRVDAPEVGAMVRDEQVPFQYEQERDRIAYYGSRIVRDRVFRQMILRAYDARCAITGLKLINGGGRAEVQAAHIRPVEASGPDSVSNGLALSGTAHWMFDRGLISLADDLKILVSRQVNDPDGVHAMINKRQRAAAAARARSSAPAFPAMASRKLLQALIAAQARSANVQAAGTNIFGKLLREFSNVSFRPHCRSTCRHRVTGARAGDTRVRRGQVQARIRRVRHQP